MKRLIFLFISLALLVSSVMAVPTTQAATAVGNNNVTLNMAGAAGDSWFQYGTDPAILNYWSNIETAATSITVSGGPIYPSTTYYFVACDSTGCAANVLSFTTAAVTPLAVPTLGTAISNMTRSQFNLLYMPSNIMVPYGWLFPDDTKQMMYTIVFGMMMLFVYMGLWLRTRSVTTAVLMGILTSSFILFANQGLNLGIPTEFANIAQGLLYASLAAVLLTLLKK